SASLGSIGRRIALGSIAGAGRHNFGAGEYSSVHGAGLALEGVRSKLHIPTARARRAWWTRWSDCEPIMAMKSLMLSNVQGGSNEDSLSLSHYIIASYSQNDQSRD